MKPILVRGGRVLDLDGDLDDPPVRDVLIEGNSIVAAFEVESTTSVYSGLLRMSDLLALQPNLSIDLFLVAPDDPISKRLFLVSTIEAEIYRLGLDTPLAKGNELSRSAARLGPAAAEDALSWAISTGHLVAATGAAELPDALGR